MHAAACWPPEANVMLKLSVKGRNHEKQSDINFRPKLKMLAWSNNSETEALNQLKLSGIVRFTQIHYIYV